MSFLRTASYWLLVLALIANVGSFSAPAAMDHSAHQATASMSDQMGAGASDATDCHGNIPVETPAQPDPAPMDCCGSGSCTCGCLHHAPFVAASETRLAAPLHGWVAQLGHLKSVPSAPVAPAIRPPIA